MKLILNPEHIEIIKRFIAVKSTKETLNTILLVESVQRMFADYSKADSELLEQDIATILYSE